MKWPHDDTASLVEFYGDPRKRGFTNNLVLVIPPWKMTYGGKPIKGVQVHRKCAESLKAVFDDIAEAVDNDWSKLPDGAVKFSGSYNFRQVRGSSRLSCHAFGAAIDLDAENNPMNTRGDLESMDDIVIKAFKRQGWYWGGDFSRRKDPMHFQAAREGSRYASLIQELNPVSTAEAEEAPMVDAHGDMDEGIDDLPEPAAPPIPTARPAVTPILASSEVTSISTAPMPNPDSVKALSKSKISWLAAGSGSFFGLGQLENVDVDKVEKIIGILKSPSAIFTMLGLACLIGIIYFRWRDHGWGRFNYRTVIPPPQNQG